jgi:uncharacterized protein
MFTMPTDDARAKVLVRAIQQGDLDLLERQLSAQPELATARIVDGGGCARTLLHVAADWPGHFPNAARTVAMLIAAGADVNAAVHHTKTNGAPETALHWAASSEDVVVLDALLDGGADLEAPGAVHTGGTPMSDAVVFAQWRAARRLLARGAATTLWQSAALGLLDRVIEQCGGTPAPTPHELTNALWHACRGGELAVVKDLVGRGADRHWLGHDRKTPLDVAVHAGHREVVAWLRGG